VNKKQINQKSKEAANAKVPINAVEKAERIVNDYLQNLETAQFSCSNIKTLSRPVKKSVFDLALNCLMLSCCAVLAALLWFSV